MCWSPNIPRNLGHFSWRLLLLFARSISEYCLCMMRSMLCRGRAEFNDMSFVGATTWNVTYFIRYTLYMRVIKTKCWSSIRFIKFGYFPYLWHTFTETVWENQRQLFLMEAITCLMNINHIPGTEFIFNLFKYLKWRSGVLSDNCIVIILQI